MQWDRRPATEAPMQFRRKKKFWERKLSRPHKYHAKWACFRSLSWPFRNCLAAQVYEMGGNAL